MKEEKKLKEKKVNKKQHTEKLEKTKKKQSSKNSVVKKAKKDKVSKVDDNIKEVSEVKTKADNLAETKSQQKALKVKKDKKEKKILTKKQIIIISSISAAVFVVALTIILCLVLIKPANNPSYPTLSSIEVHVAGKTTDYKAFDEFDDDGLKLKATYSDESTTTIAAGWTIWYVSQSGTEESLHNDCFYGGETKVKIEFNGKYCYLNVEEVERIESSLNVEISRYSQIYNGNVARLPQENINVKNSNGESVANASYEIVYCKTFNNFDDYQPTTSIDGALTEGGAPSKTGTYKVFVKLIGDKNYFDKCSNVVELNVVDETKTGLFALNGEDFFAWKEQTIPIPTDPAYIEFELMTENNKKVIKYYSTFAGNGFAYIYSDGIELNGDNEKTQIYLENDRISIKSGETTLKKWNIPGYLGSYERVVTPEYVDENFGLYLEQEQNCKLEIYVDNELNDGKVYFTYELLWRDGENLSMEIIEGFVVYSEPQSGTSSLAFNVLDGNDVTNLFIISGVLESEELDVINITIEGLSEAAISNGEYQRVS